MGLGVTQTAKGITPKAVLLGLRDQILKVNKDQILNPRRPLKLPDGTDDKANTRIPKNFQVFMLSNVSARMCFPVLVIHSSCLLRSMLCSTRMSNCFKGFA